MRTAFACFKPLLKRYNQRTHRELLHVAIPLREYKGKSNESDGKLRDSLHGRACQSCFSHDTVVENIILTVTSTGRSFKPIDIENSDAATSVVD